MTAQGKVEAAEHNGVGRNALVYLALLVMTVATYLLSRLDLGTWSTLIAMTIAVVKASLVALFFMQLWQHGGVYRLVLATALFWLALLSTLIVADVKTRFPLTNPSANPMVDHEVPSGSGSAREPTRSSPSPSRAPP